MTIRAMSLADLQTVLGWAADEGWNPGLEDAVAFHAADPSGFLIQEVDGAPVAAVSVVNHTPDTAFLGLYLCKPEYRGQGHGMAVWRAGIAHAGGRCIGLDGVPDQQSNYARSGFTKTGSTIRYEGRIEPAQDPRIRPAGSSDLAALIAYDAQATGVARDAFAVAWFASTQTRQTLVLTDGADLKGFATFRRCASGAKIGPLYAADEADAAALLAANPFATVEDPVYIDVLGQDTALAKLLTGRGFVSVFETARMYSGTPPKGAAAAFQAIATMELG